VSSVGDAYVAHVSDPPTSGERGRAHRIAIAFLVAIAIAVAAQSVVASQSDAPANVIGGDFPAFYGAGSIVLDGDWDELYSIGRQAEAQRGLHDDGEVWYFAYPPQVAVAYVPLALLPYPLAYALHTIAMAGALLGAVLLARPMVPWLRGREAIAMASALAFWPMFRAVTGGSNTALTLFLIVAAWRLVVEERPIVAGLAASMLLYKPTFAIPLIGLYLVGRYWRVVSGAAIGGIGFLASGAALLGGRWVADWLGAAADFRVVDAEVNGHSAISLVGFAENVVGTGLSPTTAVAWTLAVATVGLLCWVWWIADPTRLGVALAIAMPGMLLLSPHAMSHDGGVILLTVAVAVATWSAHDWHGWVIAIWSLGAATAFIMTIGWSPGFVGLLVVLAWVSTPIRQRSRWLRADARLCSPTDA
jgi:hypothetical protein